VTLQTISKKEKNYQAYLLRLWRDNDAASWRAMLENPHSGQRFVFANTAALYQFLDRQTGQNRSAGSEETPKS